MMAPTLLLRDAVQALETLAQGDLPAHPKIHAGVAALDTLRVNTSPAIEKRRVSIEAARRLLLLALEDHLVMGEAGRAHAAELADTIHTFTIAPKVRPQ